MSIKYNSDKPINKKSESKFTGRAEHASQVAKTIKGLNINESFVIGIYSKWGNGKTSTLNMIKEQLEPTNNICVDLSPWNFVNSKEIVGYLFLELAKIVGNHRLKRFYKKHRKDIEIFIDSAIKTAADMTTVATSNPIPNIIKKFITKIYHFVSNLVCKINKEKLEKEIQKLKKKIIVFIDDVDRLEVDDILDTFMIVKSVANIKGVHFVLAFDSAVVCQALNETPRSSERGQDFIDKIIQIPLELPTIERHELTKYMFEGLEDLCHRHKIQTLQEDPQQEQLLSIYELTQNQLSTPRTINRLLNGLEFILPATKNYVNVIDMICLEIIRITEPALYEIIRENKSIVTDTGEMGIYQDNNARKKMIEEVFIKNTRYIELVSLLFPNIRKNYYNVYDSVESTKTYRVQKRLCSANHFSRYFSYVISKNDISEETITDIIKQDTISSQDIARLIPSAAQADKAFTQIKDYVQDVNNKRQFCVELILYLDQCKWAHNRRGFLLSQIDYALHLVNKVLILPPLDSTRNLKTYLEIAGRSKNLETLTYSVRNVVVVNDNESDSQTRTLQDDDYSEYKQNISQIINEKMNQDQLPIKKYQTVSKHLYKYSVDFSGNSNHVNQYIKRRVRGPISAVDFISQFLNGWSSKVGNNYIDFKADLLSDNCAVYKLWFMQIFDATYLYNLLIKSKKYSKYKGIKQEQLKRFDQYDDCSSHSRNMAGQEQTEEFRDVIAQQFIYLFENLQQKTEHN